MKTAPRRGSFAAMTDGRYSDTACPICGYGIRRGEAAARDRNGQICHASWWRAWRYDIQGAVYQAVEGRLLPFILAAGTKEEEPDIRAVYLPDSVLSASLMEVEDILPRFQAVKEGREKPQRCGKCPYCRSMRQLMGIESGEGWDDGLADS